MTNKTFDNCISFHIDNNAFLGRIVRLDKVVNTILTKHQYPKQVSAVVAECTTLASLLASTLKYDGLFTLQTKSNGPVPLVVVDVSSDGCIRACANYDEDRIKKAQELRKMEDEYEETPHFLGEGVIAFTVDQGPNTQLYQGVVDLQGKTLSECAMRYFKQSEQIDTYLQLYMQKPLNSSEDWKTAGVLLQKIPAKGGHQVENIDVEEQWNEAKIFMESIKTDELFDTTLSSEELIHRLYHANHLVISGTKDYNFKCRCSYEKLLNTLRTFKTEDLEAMAENNKISATCQFCSEQYSFDKGELIKH